MVTCPDCQNEELIGALFCSNCGSQLALSANQCEQDGEDTPRGPDLREQDSVYKSHPEEEDRFVFLQVLRNGEILSLTGREEFTLGRAHENQPIIPDVDLNPFGGYEEGVSRLHVTIKIADRKVTITDLGSINGTELNGKKIPQQQPHLITHGDILTLGKMKMKVIIRN